MGERERVGERRREQGNNYIDEKGEDRGEGRRKREGILKREKWGNIKERDNGKRKGMGNKEREGKR